MPRRILGAGNGPAPGGTPAGRRSRRCVARSSSIRLRVEYFGWAHALAALRQGLRGSASSRAQEDLRDRREVRPRASLYIGSAHLAQGDAETALEWFRRGPEPRHRGALLRRDDRPGAGSARSSRGGGGDPRAARDRVAATVRASRSTSRWATRQSATSTARSPALERAYQARSAGLIYLHLDPGYEPLRGDPRYQELVQRIGLR